MNYVFKDTDVSGPGNTFTSPGTLRVASDIVIRFSFGFSQSIVVGLKYIEVFKTSIVQ